MRIISFYKRMFTGDWRAGSLFYQERGFEREGYEESAFTRDRYLFKPAC
jgi:hypothetical protein